MLTDKSCRAAVPGAKPIRLYDTQGLYLEISPSGGKHWRMKYRYGGKEKRLALGSYPLVPLAEARQKRDSARKMLIDGLDPILLKKEERKQALAGRENTFKTIALEWYSRHIDEWDARYARTMMKRLESDVFPILGNMPIDDIRAQDLLLLVQRIEKRKAYEIAHRAIQTCSQIFRYAVITGRADRNPASDFKGALKTVKTVHYAALDSSELPEFLAALERNDARLYLYTRLAIKFLMLTFVRTSEMIEARWEEINFEDKLWVIPAERMKMRRPHIVPLSSQALEILKQLKETSPCCPYIFPSAINARKHMSNNTVLKALDRMGYKGRMTGHGFRALAMSTIKEKLGYQHEVVDRQLAHAPRNQIDAAYDRAQYLEQRKIMMQDWADYIQAIIIGRKLPAILVNPHFRVRVLSESSGHDVA